MEQPDGIRKYRDFYEMKPGAGFVQKEFGYYCLETGTRRACRAMPT